MISHKIKIFNQLGFTLVELMLACVIFPIYVIGLATAFQTVNKSYQTSRQLNEVYAVLSACPEIDRAIDYSLLSGTTNCYPNNVFATEDATGGTITYTPTLTVTNASSLPNTDPLYNLYDSKVIDVNVSIPKSSAAALEVRLLITRNGIGQL